MIIWYERLNPNIEEPTTYLVHGGERDGQVITEAEYHAIKDKAGTGKIGLALNEWGQLGLATGKYFFNSFMSDGDPLA